MATLLSRQVEDWRNRGVISDEVAAALQADLEKSGSGSLARPANRFSFLQVLAVFAGISFAAAILVFISANWELIPRLVRVAGIVAVMFAGFAGGALAHRRGGPRGRLIEEAFYLVGGAGYVGGIALVGQMYHLGGSIAEAMLVYGLGLGLAGLLVRSPVLGALALGALTWWQVDRPDAGNLLTLHFAIFLAAVAAAWLLARAGRMRWLQRAAVAALLVGLLPFLGEVLQWLADLYSDLPDPARAAIWLVLFAAGFGLLALTRDGPVAGGRIGPARAFAIGLFALLGLHGEAGDLFPVWFSGLSGVALALAALFWHGAASRGLRFAGYALFVGEVLWLYGTTVYSLLGTAGFFFLLGLFLTAGALGITVFEKRIAARQRRGGEGGDAG